MRYPWQEISREEAHAMTREQFESWLVQRLDDIMCGGIEGASSQETKEALYTFVAEHLWLRNHP